MAVRTRHGTFPKLEPIGIRSKQLSFLCGTVLLVFGKKRTTLVPSRAARQKISPDVSTKMRLALDKLCGNGRQ